MLGKDDAGGYAFDITLQYVIGDDEEGVTITTNAIDRAVTTNGTVIITGSAADSSGTVTNLQARSGGATVSLDFFGRSEALAALAAYTATGLVTRRLQAGLCSQRTPMK